MDNLSIEEQKLLEKVNQDLLQQPAEHGGHQETDAQTLMDNLSIREQLLLEQANSLYEQAVGGEEAPPPEAATPKIVRAPKAPIIQYGAPRGPRRSNTGFYTLRQPDGWVSRVPVRAVNNARRALDEWVASIGDSQTMGRYSGQNLSVRARVKSGIQHALKTEAGHPGLLILVDVSGSCLGFAPKALNIAKVLLAAGQVSVPMIIVTHTNGAPLEALVGRGDVQDLSQVPGRPAQILSSMAAKHGITHVLAIGDADAVLEYAALASCSTVESFIWLDNYGCNWHRPRLRQPWNAALAANPKVRYVPHCRDENDLALALRLAIRS